MCVADSNKAHVLPEGDARALDVCAAVLRWGTPGAPADGGGGAWSPLMARRPRPEHARNKMRQQAGGRSACGGASPDLPQPALVPVLLRWGQVRQSKERCAETLFQLRSAPPPPQAPCASQQVAHGRTLV